MSQNCFLLLTKISQAVIKEAMRVHPSIGFPLERVVPEGGAVICGTQLPGGTIIGMSAPVVNNDKSIFGEDAEDFVPERWLNSTPEKIKTMERAFFSVSLNPFQAIVFPLAIHASC